jgi:glycosyltransferase involved in cell wall biosynthesis
VRAFEPPNPCCYSSGVPSLSVTVITKDEGAHIDACLESVAWADERLVIDCGSRDDTVARAQQAGARVIEKDWPGYAAQKNIAAAEASHDWILSLDADERVTQALAEEIRQRLSSPPEQAGFRMPRVTFHLGRWIRTTDWYPDPQLRLYDRRRARWQARRVHESVTADGAVGSLTEDLQHFAYRDIAHHVQTMDRYTTLAADDMFDTGRRASVLDLIAHPPAAFLRNYLLRRGVMDGSAGLIISAMNAHYVFLKFAKLWAKANVPPDANLSSR